MLLLFLAHDVLAGAATPANTLVPIPPNFLDFHFEPEPVAGRLRSHGELQNAYIRFIVGFEINWSLGNTATLRCQTIDPYAEDPTDSYRPEKDEEVTVSTRDGLVLFRGAVVETRERALEEPNRYTVVEVEAVGLSEPLAHRHLTATYGGDPKQIASAAVGNPAQITTREPHGLLTFDVALIRDVVYSSGAGVLTPSVVNGQHMVTVLDDYNFTIPVTNGIAAGGGTSAKLVRLRDVVAQLEPIMAEHGITVDPAMQIGPWIEKVTADDKPITDVLRHLSSQTGWPHRILPEGVFQMFAPGSIEAEFTLEPKDVGNGLQIEDKLASAANTIILKYGPSLLVTKSQQFVGDGVRRIFPLKYRPATSGSNVSPGHVLDYRASLGANGAVRHVGVWGHDTLFEWTYDASYNVDGAQGALRQLEVFLGVPLPPVPAGEVIETLFPIQFPQTVKVANVPAGHPPREAKYTAPEIHDIEAARAWAQAKLAETESQPRTARVTTTAGLVWPGAVITVNLPHRMMTGQWLVQEVRLVERGDGALEFTYTLIEGTRAGKNWQDRIRELFGGSRSTSVAGGIITGGSPGSPIPALPPGGGTVTGTGTAGRIPAWSDSSALEDSPIVLNESGAVELEADLIAQGDIYTERLTSNGAMVIDPELDLIVSPVGSVLLSPTADVVMDPDSGIVTPASNYTVHLGQASRKFLTLHAAELWINTLVAQDTVATIGGRIIVAPTTTLVNDLASGSTTIDVKHNNLSPSEVVYMESGGKVEYMTVTAGPTIIAGGYRYTVTRNLDGSGANQWYAGDAMVNTGYIGDGFIEIYSNRSAKAVGNVTERGPTIVGHKRVATQALGYTASWAIGNLHGHYGFTSDTYGVAFGIFPTAFMTITEAGGIRINQNGVDKVAILPDGTANFYGTVTAIAGNIGGWLITSAAGKGYLYSGSTSVARVGIVSSDVSTDVAFYAGDINEGSAPFRVHHNGTLFASNATISGSITATSGNITAALQAGSITASHLNVSTLSAISANLGTVTAGAIRVGSTNRIWLNDGGDGVLAVGGSDKANAPFHLSASGFLSLRHVLSIDSNGPEDIICDNRIICGSLRIESLGGSDRSLRVDSSGNVYAS